MSYFHTNPFTDYPRERIPPTIVTPRVREVTCKFVLEDGSLCGVSFWNMSPAAKWCDAHHAAGKALAMKHQKDVAAERKRKAHEQHA